MIISREQQKAYVLTGMSSSITPEQVEGLTDFIMKARERGEENISVWHQSHLYFKTPMCSCTPCSRARGDHGPSPHRAHMWQ